MSAISSALSGSGISQYLQTLTANTPNSSNASAGSFAGASGHHHHNGGGGFGKIADAITSALEQASNGSGGSVADANQTITQALTKIFSNGSIGSTGNTSDADASQSTSQAAQSGEPASTNGNLPAEFEQTLKSFGVTPQQFQSDLASALQAAQQNGHFDPSSVLKSFPPGSVVDTVG